jgi:pimeloyl-ACP methyl ester carboxylesterase
MHVLTPTHPGWNGTPRPAELSSVAALAAVYRRLLGERNLRDVLVVGSSIGGWLGAELALGDVEGRISGLVIVNAAGVDVPGQPIAQLAGLDPRAIAALSFHDPATFTASLPPPTPERIAQQRANQASLWALAGEPYMHDPTLRARLAGIHVPTLVLWGESDRVVTLEYGRAYAAAIPGARFAPIAQAGHLPHLEQPAATFAALDTFVLMKA